MFAYGLRAHDLGKFSGPGLVRAVRNAGFDGIQLAPLKAIDDFPAGPSPADARSLGDMLREGGIRVDVLGCYIDPAHPDEAARSAAVARFAREIRLCHGYGTSLIATETGRPWQTAAAFPSGPGVEPADALCGARREFDILVDSFRTLAAIARDEGVTIAVEPVWEHIVSTPRRMRDLVDAVGNPALGLLLDPCNLVSPALCEACLPGVEAGKNPSGLANPALGALALLGDRLVAVHAKDFLYRGGAKTPATCGEGLMDWKTVMSALSARAATSDSAGTVGPLPIIVEEHAPGCHAFARDFLAFQA